MAINKMAAGTIICSEKEPLKALYVIGTGKVSALFAGGELTLQKGDIIGIQDIKTGIHSCTYIAQSDTALVPYPYGGFDALLSLFSQKTEVMHLFFTAAARFSSMMLSYCNGLVKPPVHKDDSASEEPAEDLSDTGVITKSKEEEMVAKADTGPIEAKDGASTVDDIKELGDDFEEDEAPAKEDDEDEVTMEVIPVDEKDIPAELRDVLSQILDFAGVNEEISERFRQEIIEYKEMSDKESTEDKHRKLRLMITKDFYIIYKAAFEKTLEPEMIIPRAVKLFLTFGLVDAELAGYSNSVYLLGLIDRYRGNVARGVYTLPEWLTAIYEGRKEPSRNEFDLDYPAFLREQKSQGAVSEKEMKLLLNSPIDKVRFEIDNVFPIINKMTFGRITTFVPVLSEHTILKSLPDVIITPGKIDASIKNIKAIDFSAFYRETSFVHEKSGITRESIDVEVLPDVILMPNAGVRGAMWQEIEGKRRTTPARMMLSALCMEDIDKLLIRMTGEFRWEMCKRIQGAHWNNIAERSLTSEYSDYIQFYRRNRDISPEAREKIKLSLTKAKNSMKEMFIMDYTNWLKYECNGSPRLNKIARGILFTYCPFKQDIRYKLAQHPLYGNLIEKHGIRMNQKLHHLEILQTKVEKEGKKIPVEIERQFEFFKM